MYAGLQCNQLTVMLGSNLITSNMSDGILHIFSCTGIRCICCRLISFHELVPARFNFCCVKVKSHVEECKVQFQKFMKNVVLLPGHAARLMNTSLQPSAHCSVCCYIDISTLLGGVLYASKEVKFDCGSHCCSWLANCCSRITLIAALWDLL